MQKIGVVFYKFIEGIALDGLHLALVPGELVFHLDDLPLGLQSFFVDCARSVKALILGKIAQAGTSREGHSAAVGFHLSGHDP